MDKNFVDTVDALVNEIKGYEQVISDANCAMDSAENELAGVLSDHEAEMAE